jgi:hypothetical protein
MTRKRSRLRGDLRLDPLELRQHLIGSFHEQSPRVGQLQPAAHLPRENGSGLALQRAELLRDRRRRERQRLGRTGDRAPCVELAQHRQLSRIQHQLSLTEQNR